MGEDFSRQTRRFSAAILTDCKGKLYNQPTTTFTPLETVQTGACTYKIFVYKSADISYNESAML